MHEALSRDYEAMAGMVFGEIPALSAVLSSIERFEEIVNSAVVAETLLQKEPRT
jgi:hypothetical protein